MTSKVLFSCVMTVFVTILFAAPVSALCGDVCEVSLRPQVVSVPLPLEGWVFADASAVTVTVIDYPRHGLWLAEVYTPEPEFWQVGADRIRLEVEDVASGSKSQHTLLIKVATLTGSEAYAEDFEAGSLSALEPDWALISSAGATVSAVDPIAGSYSLEIDHAVGSPRIERADDASLRSVVGQMSASAVINASPPNFGFSTFSYTIMTLEDLVEITLTHDGTAYWLQASLENIGCPIDPCVTQPQPILADRDYEILASIGQRGVEHPFLESSNSFDLTVTDLTTALPERRMIANLAPLPNRAETPTSTIGAFNVVGPAGPAEAVLRIDSFGYQEGGLAPSAYSASIEDYVDGSWSPDWLPLGAVSTIGSWVNGSAIWSGIVDLNATEAGGSDSQWLDLAPDDSDTVWTHLKLGTEQLELGQWGVFHLIEGKDAAGEKHLFLQIRANGHYELQLRAVARDGTGDGKMTPWLDVPGDWTQVELAWNGVEGWLQLWLNGVPAAGLDLVPGPYGLDQIGLGVSALFSGVTSMPAGSRVLIDDLAVFYD